MRRRVLLIRPVEIVRLISRGQLNRSTPDIAAPTVTETSKQKHQPMFVIVACVFCAIAFAFTCWNQTLRSDAEPNTRDYWFLLLYQGLSLISYLSVLWFFGRLSNFRGTEIIVALFLISVFGTIVPYVASSVQIWANHQLEQIGRAHV